jgi:hypothetical protein
MQHALIRCRRQDTVLRIGTLTVIFAIFSAFAAPQVLDQTSGQTARAPIPLFEPYRTVANN